MHDTHDRLTMRAPNTQAIAPRLVRREDGGNGGDNRPDNPNVGVVTKTLPSLAHKRLQDLRDTAFSWAREAGMDDDQTASRTLQSRTSIKALGDKAYGEIGPAIADAAVAKLDALYLKIGASLT